MTFKKVLSFFLTGATALSMTTAALAADDTPIMLPADVASQDWYAPAVRYVMEYDLMDVGRPDDGTTVFEPLRTVSRQEVADAICRAARCLSTKFAGEPSQSGISGMADYAEIGQDYYNAMAFCYENGIMTGSDKKLNPGAAITRQEFAAVLQRTMKLFAENGLAEIVPATAWRSMSSATAAASRTGPSRRFRSASRTTLCRETTGTHSTRRAM